MTSRSNAADTIKSVLEMPDVAYRYGFEPNRAGFIPCPFHGEKKSSLKLYPGLRGWYCFGCNTGGDVIDFARRLFNLEFREAVERLSRDFGIGVSFEPVSAAELHRIHFERDRREVAEEIKQERLNALSAEHRRLWRIYIDHPPQFGEDPSQEWVSAVHRLPHLEYLLYGE